MKNLTQSWSTISSYFQDKQLSIASWTLLLLSGILQFIFSLSHGIALRKLFLLITFLIAFKYVWKAVLEKKKPLLSIMIIFVLLQVWMLIVAGFVSNDPLASLAEWKGQWLPVFMSFVIGIGLACTLMHSKFKYPRVVIVLSIIVPITIFLFLNLTAIIHDWILAGRFVPSLGGIGDHHGISSYLAALLEPILIVDLFRRWVKGSRVLPAPGWVTSAILILCVGTLIATTDRNGIISLFVTLVLVTLIMYHEFKKNYSAKQNSFLVLTVVVIVSAIALISYKIDPRWKSFVETAPIAWDIDRDQLWLNDDGTNLPKTPSGRKVDVSEYYRIAWAHEGWRMLVAHHWGMEISRDTFHELVLAKYGHTTIPHSHNSWIDFGLNVGIPGLVLWVSILILLAKFGWQAWSKNKDPLGLALAVLILMFAVRGLMDSIFRDHEIEQLMMVAGLLFGTLLVEKYNKTIQTES